MTKSTITRGRLEKIKSWRETYGAGSNVMLPAEEAEKLALIALAAMDCEPVAYIDKQWTLVYYVPPMSMGLKIGDKLYRHAQPAPERDQVRREHAEWSHATFGNVGPVGPLKHLSKEALEAAAEPGDLSEWADMQFLLWDAQRRAGITDEQITKAMIEKLAVNKLRDWPEPKDGEPRLHIKEQPAPVVPAVSDDIGEIRVGRLPTMNQDDYPGLGDWWVQLRIGEDSDEVLARVYGATPQEANNRAEALACRAATLQAGNSPVIPDGYVMVPKEPTAEMIAAAMNCDDVLFNSDESFCVQFGNIYEAMLAAAPHDTPALDSVQSVVTVSDTWVPVSERMPEDRTQVILWDAEIGEVTSGHYSHKTHTFYHCGDAIQNEITHWMPLPAAPQEVKGES